MKLPCLARAEQGRGFMIHARVRHKHSLLWPWQRFYLFHELGCHGEHLKWRIVASRCCECWRKPHTVCTLLADFQGSFRKRHFHSAQFEYSCLHAVL